MTNNAKISLDQWTKLILNFATVVLLFLILLLWLTKQSKAPEERQTAMTSRNKQRMLSQSYSSHFAQLLSHYSHSKSFHGHQFAKSLIQYLHYDIFISK